VQKKDKWLLQTGWLLQSHIPSLIVEKGQNLAFLSILLTASVTEFLS